MGKTAYLDLHERNSEASPEISPKRAVRSHRSEIDGLRALAVIPVLLVHANFSFIPGGFIGVDIFFVISGFLITGIVFKEVRNDAFSLIGFYERRARRILPALFLVTATCSVAFYFIMLPDAYKNFGQSLLAVNLFIPNIFFARENGYFETASELKPLLHTWSLGVEEQFYIIYPIIILLVSRLSNTLRLSVIFFLALASLAFAQIGSSFFPQTNFFILPGRAWELIAGSLLALAPFEREVLAARYGKLFQSLSLVGLSLIILSYILIDPSVPSPSIALLPAIIGVMLVIACATQSTITYRLLANPVMISIGLISYSAYLWHQPVFVFARLALDEVTPVTYALLIIGTLILAYGTWRYVERPFRDRARIGYKKIFMLSCFGIALSIAGGAGIHVAEGFPSRFTGENAIIAEGATSISPYRDTCGNITPASFDGYCLFGNADAHRTAFIGDSHGKELFWRATLKLADENHGLQPFLWNACLPFSSIIQDARTEECNTFHQRMSSYILEESNINQIVISANWQLYYYCDDDCPTPFGFTGDKARDPRAWEATFQAAIEAEIRAYTTAGKQVILIGQVPPMPWQVPQHMLIKNLFGQGGAGISISLGEHRRKTADLQRMLEAIVAKTDIGFLDPADVLCDAQTDRCHAAEGPMPLYFDNGHLNGLGAERLVEVLRDRFWRTAEASVP